MTFLIVILSVLVIGGIIAFIIWLKYESIPLFKAIKSSNTQEALKIIGQGADVNARNAAGETPLICAAQVGNVKVVEILLRSGADPNEGILGVCISPLGVAAGQCNEEIVRLLIEAGADVNGTDWVGNTALMSAASSGCDRAVGDLLRAGADPNAKNNEGITALFCAIFAGKRNEIFWSLINAGAEVGFSGDSTQNTFALCLGSAQYEMAEGILEHRIGGGFEIHSEDRYGGTILTSVVSTALREEAMGNHPLIRMIRKLVDAGADTKLAQGIATQHYAPEFFDGYKREIIDILRKGLV